MVTVRPWISGNIILYLCVREYVCVRVFVCVRACAWECVLCAYVMLLSSVTEISLMTSIRNHRLAKKRECDVFQTSIRQSVDRKLVFEWLAFLGSKILLSGWTDF